MAQTSESVRMGFQKGGRETTARLKNTVIASFGNDFFEAFNDPETTELYRNADGMVFQLRVGHPKRRIADMDSATAMLGIKTCVGAMGLVITKDSPRVDTEFVVDGSRFAACIPPASLSPTFNIRKKAIAVFSLEEYVSNGILRRDHCQMLMDAIKRHRNILVMGGTGSGKTTLANALIMEISNQYPDERLVIIEDTQEIQCVAEDHLLLHTVPLADPPVLITDLVKHSLRVKPDRILVGEVRGGEGLDLLDAWNTGHEGGIVTLHANNARSGLTRLESLVSRNKFAPESIHAIRRLIGEAVHMIVHIALEGTRRRVREILEIDGYDEEKRAYNILGKGFATSKVDETAGEMKRLKEENDWLKAKMFALGISLEDEKEDEIGLDDHGIMGELTAMVQKEEKGVV